MVKMSYYLNLFLYFVLIRRSVRFNDGVWRHSHESHALSQNSIENVNLKTTMFENNNFLTAFTTARVKSLSNLCYSCKSRFSSFHVP